MTKGYVCVECGSQIVGHSKVACDAQRTAVLFENWWHETGNILIPIMRDVPWFDKRKELAGLAYMAGRNEANEQLAASNRLYEDALRRSEEWQKRAGRSEELPDACRRILDRRY